VLCGPGPGAPVPTVRQRRDIAIEPLVDGAYEPLAAVVIETVRIGEQSNLPRLLRRWPHDPAGSRCTTTTPGRPTSTIGSPGAAKSKSIQATGRPATNTAFVRARVVMADDANATESAGGVVPVP